MSTLTKLETLLLGVVSIISADELIRACSNLHHFTIQTLHEGSLPGGTDSRYVWIDSIVKRLPYLEYVDDRARYLTTQQLTTMPTLRTFKNKVYFNLELLVPLQQLEELRFEICTFAPGVNYRFLLHLPKLKTLFIHHGHVNRYNHFAIFQIQLFLDVVGELPFSKY